MILITGATGFLGSELARQLAEQGLPVRCIKRPTSIIPDLLKSYNDLITWVEADIMDIYSLETAFEGITQVYHCAAWVSLKRADKDAMINVNVNGTANVVNVCLQYGARLVHVSSVAAIGDARPGELITEHHYLETDGNTDGYAISKLESEMEVWRGIAEGLDAVIVNPSLIIGPNAGTQGSGQLFETVRKGLKFYTNGSIGFVAVEDVAKSMIALMNSDIRAERFIVSAENRDYKSLVAEIARNFNIPPPRREAKPWMMELAWRGAVLLAAITGKAPAIDKVAAESAGMQRNYDNTKLKETTGIVFKPISQSIAEVCGRLKR
jgi:nucleoside-diphosphate-sugar epimerase